MINFATTQTALSGVPLSLVELTEHYGFNAINADGTGQSIAILIPGPLDPNQLRSDLSSSVDQRNSAASKLGLKAIADAQIKITFQDSSLNQTGVSAVEATLDTQVAHAVAPGAKINLIVFRKGGANMYRALQTALQEHAQIVSMSYGRSESEDPPSLRQTISAFFETHPEVTFIAASGDKGYNVNFVGIPHVAFPASSPFVLAVGAVNEDFSEHPQVWPNSGGGESRVFSRPPYQNRLNWSGTDRLLPDVAMAGGDRHPVAVIVGGKPTLLNGTSVAAPIFAGLVARANQRCGSALGFINPIIYGLYGSPGYARNFRDSQLAGDPSTVGFDLQTGLGVPRVQSFINYLVRESRRCSHKMTGNE